jgi:hypothetical protein
MIVQDYVPQGLYVNGPAITGSFVLLVVIRATGFGRLFGINELVERWARARREKKRIDIIETRSKLEDEWDGSD